MVKARKPAANQFADSPSIITAMPDSASPTASASGPATLPEGMGRDFVRFITASISASYHIFSAPEAPPPMAMNSTEQKAISGCTLPGATIRPTKAVKTTSDMTRGFSSAT